MKSLEVAKTVGQQRGSKYIINRSIIGSIGIVMNTRYYTPASNSSQDIAAKELALQFSVSQFSLIIFTVTSNIFYSLACLRIQFSTQAETTRKL